LRALASTNHGGGPIHFAKSVFTIPEIVECHRMTGDTDYLLKIVTRDLGHYDQVYRILISSVPDLTDVSFAFSLERLKSESLIDWTKIDICV
jgi:Lrp/AsnC family transcriptional regulator